jgi:hypothetical protein
MNCATAKAPWWPLRPLYHSGHTQGECGGICGKRLVNCCYPIGSAPASSLPGLPKPAWGDYHELL